MLLNEAQLDIIKELINIGVGRAAAMLNEMLNSNIKLNVPNVKVLSDLSDFNESHQISNDILTSVKLEFNGEISGTIKLIFQPDSAAKLVSLLTGEEVGTVDLDSVRVGTLNEVGNILLNSVLGSVSNVLKSQFNFTLPSYTEDIYMNLLNDKKIKNDPVFLISQAHFEIEHLEVGGDILLILGMDSFDELKLALNQLV